MSKYAALWAAVGAQREERFTLSYAEIEELGGVPLVPSCASKRSFPPTATK